MKKQIASLRSFESGIEKGFAKYTRPDLETLRDELRTFLALVELRIPIAPEPAQEKKSHHRCEETREARKTVKCKRN